jgi:hypothetical protein
VVSDICKQSSTQIGRPDFVDRRRAVVLVSNMKGFEIAEVLRRGRIDRMDENILQRKSSTLAELKYLNTGSISRDLKLRFRMTE